LTQKLRDANQEIEALRKIVRENAAKDLREKVSVGIQCDAIPPDGHGWTAGNAAISISESIRQAAQDAQNAQLLDELEQRGFIYEATR
jgi:hypothetical protein